MTEAEYLWDGPVVSESLQGLGHNPVLTEDVDFSLLEQALAAFELPLVVVHGIGNINFALKMWVKI